MHQTEPVRYGNILNDTDVHMGGGLYSKIKLVYYLSKENTQWSFLEMSFRHYNWVAYNLMGL